MVKANINEQLTDTVDVQAFLVQAQDDQIT